MKLVDSPGAEGVQAEIKRRFAEFNKTSSPSRGRRYPEQLKQLIGQAAVRGVKTVVLCRLSGLSASAVNRYRATVNPQVAVPRRLSVVDASPVDLTMAAVVIRLSSGVTIELADSRSLSGHLLSTLNALEARHAASC